VAKESNDDNEEVVTAAVRRAEKLLCGKNGFSEDSACAGILSSTCANPAVRVLAVTSNFVASHIGPTAY
jgi:hypothetical protein